VTDALLLVDVIKDFRHEDGERLLASYRERFDALKATLERAREDEVPVIFANDNSGIWDGDARRLVRQAVEEGLAGDLVEQIAPREGDRFVVKPRYSAFDATPLTLILRELEMERILLAGTATEMCVLQTAIDGLRHGFDVTVAAGACATVDPERERIALGYLTKVLGIGLA
jgi:nicotinamidase-related amidase